MLYHKKLGDCVWRSVRKSRITIHTPYLTHAGQTAPGDGVTLANRKFDIRTYDVIIQFRRGVYEDDTDEWTFRIRGGTHVIAVSRNTSCRVGGPLERSIHKTR